MPLDAEAISGSRHRHGADASDIAFVSRARHADAESTVGSRHRHGGKAEHTAHQDAIESAAHETLIDDEAVDCVSEGIDGESMGVVHGEQLTVVERSASLHVDPKMRELRRYLSRSVSESQPARPSSAPGYQRPGRAATIIGRSVSASRLQRPASAVARLQRQRADFAGLRCEGVRAVEQRVRRLGAAAASEQQHGHAASAGAASAAHGSGVPPWRARSAAQAARAAQARAPHTPACPPVAEPAPPRRGAPQLALQEQYSRSLRRLLLEPELDSADCLTLGGAPAGIPSTSQTSASTVRVHELRCGHLDNMFLWHERHKGAVHTRERPSTHGSQSLNYLRFDPKKHVMPGSLRHTPMELQRAVPLPTVALVGNRRLQSDDSDNADVRPVFKAILWKLSVRGNMLHMDDWWEREQWTSVNGNLVYFSRKESANLIYFKSEDLQDASISIICEEEPSRTCMKPWAFSVACNGLDCAFLAASDAKHLQLWIQALRDAGQVASRGSAK